MSENLEQAILAGACFGGVQGLVRRQLGVAARPSHHHEEPPCLL